MYLLPLISFVVLFGTVTSSDSFGQCSNDQQRRILPTLLDCQPRDEVISLDLPNDTFVHILPSHVTVKRCGGSSSNRFHSCLPKSTTKKSVSVLLFPYSAQAGAVDSVCADARVDEHLECESRCETQPSDCHPNIHHFSRAECRCVCANEHERAECLNRGRYWNSALCQCMCSHPVYFPQCPTGYHYDAFNSCACISLAGNASALLEILIILLVSSTLVALFGVYQCRRYQVGFFQKREGREADDQVDTSRMIELRTIFRQISHQSPGFLRQLSSHHHEPIRQIIPERTTLAVPSEAMAKKSRSMEVMAPLISIKEGSSSQA